MNNLSYLLNTDQVDEAVHERPGPRFKAKNRTIAEGAEGSTMSDSKRSSANQVRSVLCTYHAKA